MEAKTIQFAVRDNNNFFKLELSKALLHLIEFDFTYFWEKCIDAGRAAKKTGRLPQNDVSNAKATVSGFHPYVEALINDDFSDIVTDCIIEYICHSERISLEELWVRCISPKTPYEEAIFNRISKYKTGKASNQWANIVRIQEYARNKTAFIYDCDDEQKVPLPYDILHTRKEYFDLACSVAANELGIQGDKCPSVKFGAPALMPNATFMNSKISREIYRRFSAAIEDGEDMTVPESKNCAYLKDKIAMNAYSIVRGMKRPDDPDMKFAVEELKDNAVEIYMPDSFKAVVDLEFDLMMKYNIVLRKCESCGRYFVAEGDSFYCSRINSSGKTCLEQYEEMCSSIAKAAENAVIEEVEEVIEEAVEAEKKAGVIPAELEKRSQKIYNALYKRAGKGMEEKEFREWSRYLSDLKRNIKICEATVEEFEEFLDYSDKLCDEVKNAQKNKSAAKAEFNYPDNKNNAEAAAPKPEPVRVISAEEAEVKPYTPEAFDNLFDTFMSEHTAEVSEPTDASPEKPTKKAVEIKAPQWKRMTRAEAYGLKDGEDI